MKNQLLIILILSACTLHLQAAEFIKLSFQKATLPPVVQASDKELKKVYDNPSSLNYYRERTLNPVDAMHRSTIELLRNWNLLRFVDDRAQTIKNNLSKEIVSFKDLQDAEKATIEAFKFARIANFACIQKAQQTNLRRRSHIGKHKK